MKNGAVFVTCFPGTDKAYTHFKEIHAIEEQTGALGYQGQSISRWKIQPGPSMKGDV